MWSVVSDAERAQWNHVPFTCVGPLRFGMSLEQVATALGEQGFTVRDSSMSRPHGALARRVGFRSKDAPFGMEAVTAYHRESGELTAIAIDALRGPQVSSDGIRLIGRVPSELLDQVLGYAEDRGMMPTASVEGDAISEELGLLVRAQRAGDVLLTRAFFVADFHDWANTMHDCVPADEWNVR